VLFACLLGRVVVTWSLLRISAPQRRFGRFDGFARMLFSTWMIWALAVTGIPLQWLFIVPEIMFCVAQWRPVSDRPVAGIEARTGLNVHSRRSYLGR
jgi:hypothetical protein